MLSASFAIIAVVATTAISAPIHQRYQPRLEKSLEQFLDDYYDKFLGKSTESSSLETADEGGGIYDTMQGDQAVDDNDNNNNVNLNGPLEMIRNNTGNYTQSELDYFRTMRNRTKDHWIQTLKEKILRQIGRTNTTSLTKGPENSTSSGGGLESINISAIIPTLLNGSHGNINFMNDNDNEDQITEKIRSHYPSCEVPQNADQDAWKDENAMNLYFQFDYNPSDRMNIATAFLRLYRLPFDNENANSTKVANPDCDNNGTAGESEDRLLRVSVYWYTKTLKKKRVKRRLSDSRVITENAEWVELSVKPATRAWSRGRNLGLAVIVEDQDGNVLKADRYFKGIDCMVGSSTPRPIPTIVIDAARSADGLGRLAGLLGGNSTSRLHRHPAPMPPSIDVCTLEFPENYSQSGGGNASSLRVNACNLRKLHEHRQLAADREKLERLATLPDLLAPSARHIRHQRQHHAAFDPRASFVNQRVLTPEEVRSLNLSLPSRNR